MDVKQIIVVRTELNMRKGKLAAQVAHASLGVVLNLMQAEGDSRRLPLPDGTPLHAWVTGCFKKIVVGVNTEAELHALHERAKEAGLLCCLIRDSGLTEFGGVPTYTTLAIGPAESEVLAPITGALRLL